MLIQYPDPQPEVFFVMGRTLKQVLAKLQKKRRDKIEARSAELVAQQGRPLPVRRKRGARKSAPRPS